MSTKTNTLVACAAAAALLLGACALPSETDEHSAETVQAGNGGESAREAAEYESAEVGDAPEASETAPHGDPALQRLAQLSLQQAQNAALAARPGTVSDWELEREAGGSNLRYSFDISTPQGLFEVGIDAANGRVLENAPADND